MTPYENYQWRWGNYKSDKYKSKKILRCEITALLHIGEFTKKDMIAIKDYMKRRAFKFDSSPGA